MVQNYIRDLLNKLIEIECKDHKEVSKEEGLIAYHTVYGILDEHEELFLELLGKFESEANDENYYSLSTIITTAVKNKKHYGTKYTKQISEMFSNLAKREDVSIHFREHVMHTLTATVCEFSKKNDANVMNAVAVFEELKNNDNNEVAIQAQYNIDVLAYKNMFDGQKLLNTSFISNIDDCVENRLKYERDIVETCYYLPHIYNKFPVGVVYMDEREWEMMRQQENVVDPNVTTDKFLAYTM